MQRNPGNARCGALDAKLPHAAPTRCNLKQQGMAATAKLEQMAPNQPPVEQAREKKDINLDQSFRPTIT